MSATSWTAVRVSADTKARLERLRDLWTELADRTGDQLGSSATRSGQESKNDRIGHDQVIKRLILLWERHQERSKRAGQKRRAKKDEPGDGGGQGGGGQGGGGQSGGGQGGGGQGGGGQSGGGQDQGGGDNRQVMDCKENPS